MAKMAEKLCWKCEHWRAVPIGVTKPETSAWLKNTFGLCELIKEKLYEDWFPPMVFVKADAGCRKWKLPKTPRVCGDCKEYAAGRCAVAEWLLTLSGFVPDFRVRKDAPACHRFLQKR